MLSGGYDARTAEVMDCRIKTRSPIMDVLDLTIERETRRTERTAQNFGWGATDGALGIAQRFFGTYVELFTEALKGTKGLTGPARSMLELDPEIVTLAAIQGALTAIGGAQNLSFTKRSIGGLLEDELYAHNLRTWDEKVANEILTLSRKRNGSYKGRKYAVRSLAKQKGFSQKPDWKDGDRLRVGAFCLGVLLSGPVFVYEDEAKQYLTITPEAMEVSEAVLARVIENRPAMLPSLEVPPAWEKPETTLAGGFLRPLVSRHDGALQRHLKRSSREGKLDRTYSALNAIQGTAWSINEPILELIQWCYDNDVAVEGVPGKSVLPMPDRIPEDHWDLMSDDQKKAHRNDIGKIRTRNRGLVGERLMLTRDLETARYLVANGNKFWTPCSLDYRGRVYGMPSFNFQRGDAVRGMFQFSEGKPLDERGLYWLKVHVANCGAFEKIDKQPFDGRVKWVDQNMELVRMTGSYPKEELTWTTADKPFMFVAACRALTFLDPEGAFHDFPCHIPVSFDGSCSGLQHLCAMTQAEEGRLVNLVPADAPSDIYATVAQTVEDYVKLDAENHELPEVRALAKNWLEHGITRALVKRNVMTYSYSSGRFGMGQQIMDDTMRPLELRVLSGELPVHPFAPEPHVAARYLAKRSHEAIEDTVSKPAEAMRFLQGIARAAAHEGKPLVWHTPLGFPVMLRYMMRTTSYVNLSFMDRGVKRRYQARSLTDSDKINKRKMANAIAPSFVHSLDACHLMMAVLRAKDAGIDNIALVHDSFGCLPTDADKFRAVILESFRDLYTEHDVLGAIRQEAIDQLHTSNTRLPETPVPGFLDLNQITEAQYAFS